MKNTIVEVIYLYDQHVEKYSDKVSNIGISYT
jgi:hypothetical protein